MVFGFKIMARGILSRSHLLEAVAPEANCRGVFGKYGGYETGHHLIIKFIRSSNLRIIKRGTIGLEESCVSATLGDQFRMAPMFNDPSGA
jgi:hypothetical protein